MRLLPPILMAALLVFLPAEGESRLTDAQAETLLERYEAGVREGKFEYRPGKSRSDLESYLRNGNLPGIRREILLGVEQRLPEDAPQSEPGWREGGFGSDDTNRDSWASDAGWGDDPAGSSAEVTGWIQAVAEAAQICNYAEAKRLADLILKNDPTNDWINANYSEIEVWAARSADYFAALQEAYTALEVDDFDSLVTHLRTALENAASNCGQDEVARSLLSQALETSQNERATAIAQARQEGLIHQQTFAQTLTNAPSIANTTPDKGKDGGKRGLMGLLNTAIRVSALRRSGNLSSEDALVQVLQQQAMQANPEIGQLVSQAQQLQSGGTGTDPNALIQTLQQQAAQSNPQLAQTLSQLQQLQQPGQNGFPAGINSTPTPVATPANANVTVSPACQKIMDRLEVIGKEITATSQILVNYQSNPKSVSQSQLQSIAARMDMLRQESSALIKQLKANNCPGANAIPDVPGF